MSIIDWITGPSGELKKILKVNLFGEVPVSCGPQDSQHMKMGFIGDVNAKKIQDSLEKYDQDVKSKDANGASGSYSLDQGAKECNKKMINLLEIYRDELKNFKKNDFSSSSTLKRLTDTRRKMKEILTKLQGVCEKGLKNFSDNSMREAAKKNDQLKDYVPVRIWSDFIEDVSADAKTTIDQLPKVIDLAGSKIDFDKLQLNPVKGGFMGKKTVNRKESLEKNVKAKLESDIKKHMRKMDYDLKKAKVSQEKINKDYEKLKNSENKIASNVNNEEDLEQIRWKVKGFKEYCKEIDDLIAKIEVLVNLSKEGYENYIKQEDLKITKDAAEFAKETDENLKEIQNLYVKSQNTMKILENELKRVAKIKAI